MRIGVVGIGDTASMPLGTNLRELYYLATIRPAVTTTAGLFTLFFLI